MKDGDKEFIVCECESLEHLACFNYIEEECSDDEGCVINLKYVTLSVRLKKLPFLLRLVKGIKYIFGDTSVYGDYDEFIINAKDVNKFKHVVKYLEKCKK